MARCRDIQYGIISLLMDGKKHTITELATNLNVSYKTISRHLNDLSTYYPLSTYVGGRDSGGVQLKNTFIHTNLFNNEDLSLILEGLTQLNQQSPEIIKLMVKVKNAMQKHPHADTPAISSVRSKENGQVM